MTINLPLATTLPPRWRIMRKKTWKGAWEVLPTDGLLGTSKLTRNGWFHVEEFWQSCIPEPGQAIISFEFGQIDGQEVGLDAAGTHRDSFAPGADHILGTRHFYCIDLLAFVTKRQPMDRHGVYVNSSTNYYLNCTGHPGYNSCDWTGLVIGNRSPNKYYDAPSVQSSLLPWTAETFSSGAVQSNFRDRLYCHTHPGSTSVWTDLQAVDHALSATRAPDSPVLYVHPTLSEVSLLSTSNSWPVHPGMMAYDYLAQVFRRQRGRGVAFLSWDDDSSDPNAEIVPYIVVLPQNVDDINYTQPSTGGAANTIYGATTKGSTVTVDLENDHRNIASTFEMGDRFQHAYEWVESVGEYMQVLGTLDLKYGARGPGNSLQERWSAADETSMIADYAVDPSKTKDPKHDHTWQLFGLSYSWSGLAGNGEATGAYDRIDYRCNDAGEIFKPDATGTAAVFPTSPLLCKVMDDLPLYNGYNYTSTPAPYDGGTKDASPERCGVLLLVREAAGSFRLASSETYNLQVRNTPNGLLIYSGQDMQNGTRIFSNNADFGGANRISHTSLVATVGIELPHRVRMATGGITTVDGVYQYASERTAQRKLTIYHPGLHLWVAPPSAIWKTDGVEGDDGFAVLRQACGIANTSEHPGILRDDRDRLAALHNLACSWYLNERRTVSWQLRACGFLPSFLSEDEEGQPATTAIEYATLGQLPTTLRGGGITHNINTPITKIHFTNSGNGVTTWVTDWSDLDFR